VKDTHEHRTRGRRSAPHTKPSAARRQLPTSRPALHLHPMPCTVPLSLPPDCMTAMRVWASVLAANTWPCHGVWRLGCFRTATPWLLTAAAARRSNRPAKPRGYRNCVEKVCRYSCVMVEPRRWLALPILPCPRAGGRTQAQREARHPQRCEPACAPAAPCCDCPVRCCHCIGVGSRRRGLQLRYGPGKGTRLGTKTRDAPTATVASPLRLFQREARATRVAVTFVWRAMLTVAGLRVGGARDRGGLLVFPEGKCNIITTVKQVGNLQRQPACKGQCQVKGGAQLRKAPPSHQGPSSSSSSSQRRKSPVRTSMTTQTCMPSSNRKSLAAQAAASHPVWGPRPQGSAQ
jgi:hypothetical protein